MAFVRHNDFTNIDFIYLYPLEVKTVMVVSGKKLHFFESGLSTRARRTKGELLWSIFV